MWAGHHLQRHARHEADNLFMIRGVVRRRDAKLPELLFGLFGHPVRRPSGRELRDHPCVQSCSLKAGPHIVLNLAHGRTATVGRRDHHLKTIIGLPNIPENAELTQGHNRDLGVGQVLQRRPDFVDNRAHD